MMPKLRKLSRAWDDEALLFEALVSLRNARDNLSIIRAERACRAVRRALKSAEGAGRHLDRLLQAAGRPRRYSFRVTD